MFAESLRHDLEILLGARRERLQPEDLDRAVDLIVGAERVCIVGGVTAFGVAYYAAVTLDRVREGRRPA